MNLFIFPDVYPHRLSPMSILILFFAVLCAFAPPRDARQFTLFSAPPRDAQIPSLFH